MKLKAVWLSAIVGHVANSSENQAFLRGPHAHEPKKQRQLAPESLVNPGICLSGLFLNHGYCPCFPDGIWLSWSWHSFTWVFPSRLPFRRDFKTVFIHAKELPLQPRNFPLHVPGA